MLCLHVRKRMRDGTSDEAREGTRAQVRGAKSKNKKLKVESFVSLIALIYRNSAAINEQRQGSLGHKTRAANKRLTLSR
jgi:hypothetical protein